MFSCAFLLVYAAHVELVLGTRAEVNAGSLWRNWRRLLILFVVTTGWLMKLFERFSRASKALLKGLQLHSYTPYPFIGKPLIINESLKAIGKTNQKTIKTYETYQNIRKS